jgi:hypothetical protein
MVNETLQVQESIPVEIISLTSASLRFSAIIEQPSISLEIDTFSLQIIEIHPAPAMEYVCVFSSMLTDVWPIMRTCHSS